MTRYFASRAIAAGTGKAKCWASPRKPEEGEHAGVVAHIVSGCRHFIFGFALGLILLITFAKVWDLAQSRLEITPDGCEVRIGPECIILPGDRV